MKITTDSWVLRTMREAKAFRDANPDPDFAESDAHLDAYLAACEDAVAEVGTTTERPASDDEPARRPGSGYRAAPVPPTAKQLAFIDSLRRERGIVDGTAPYSKSEASTMIEKLLATKVTPTVRMATERQRELIASLLVERAYGAEVDVDKLSAAQASQLIDALFAAPRATVAAHGIKEGRYAFQPADAQAMFLRVARNGRIYVQAGPAEHPYSGRDTEALRWIKDNQRDAAALYGRLLGVCGICGRALTDETSRALGLGPICANK